ncbi:MAG: efflux RND transporter periplasmic adaptor subunit [Chryseobacterium sp.]|uniref:efflux RND transporter periplasmic adaptor subunit n=1 Tax=Chryseobacterium sp. TaxID=1871047 RepID=UPI000DB706A2|nr:efflux RND transporter periplasmic adaptor subunit [Chryseobacterium sp.]MPS65373.1 efflux RND transporter periplasmic adaptor subunit [Chryseobacterium sp.]PZU15398.1 MAG: efflux RND transporter periplasmic adaptor subunit [Chryseobacterium sp.]
MNPKYKKYFKNSIITLVAVIAVFFIYQYFTQKKEAKISIQTVKLSKQNITTSVTATGTVEPVDQVEVGTQVSGIINHIYADYNSQVKKGQLLAELDKTNLQESVNNALAQYEAALNELNYYQQNYNRQNNMFRSGVISKADYEQAAYQVKNSQQTVNQRKTALAQARTNLSYANIYAPIDGIILSREVEEGQTVAASMTTPTLFSIAKDITKMQVEANVDEADIGDVKVGQRVSFTVDAYPQEEFNGKVRQVRLAATTESNVVTYTVIIDADNSEQKLKPGLTATVTIFTQELKNINTVPAAAISFSPDTEILQKYYLQNQLTGKVPETKTGKNKEKYIWIINKDKSLSQKQITVGINDGINVQVNNGLTGDEQIVTALDEQQEAVAKSGSESSPFMPKRPNSNNKKSSSSQGPPPGN